MTTWIVDLQARVGQRVQPSTPMPQDPRLRKVEGATLRDAIDRAQMESAAITKLQVIQTGDAAIMSDVELDWLIDQDVYPTNAVSIPNPTRCGLLDAYLVASKNHPAVKAYTQKVLDQYEAQPAIREYRRQQNLALARAA